MNCALYNCQKSLSLRTFSWADFPAYSSWLIYKFTNLRIYKFTNLQVYKFTRLQVYKFTNLQHVQSMTQPQEETRDVTFTKFNILCRYFWFQKTVIYVYDWVAVWGHFPCWRQESRDGQTLFEFKMYLQKRCIIVLRVGSS